MTTSDDDTTLAGQLLVAMPAMSDPRFAKSVVFLCAHSDEGAMGLIVNRTLPQIDLASLLRQIDVEPAEGMEHTSVHFGGPVETGRGFVLHSTDAEYEGTQAVDDQFALTVTLDVLRAIASRRGPARQVTALGYAGWGPGQLDTEIQDNAWLLVPADPHLVFEVDNGAKWHEALNKIGVDPNLLSSQAGHA